MNLTGAISFTLWNMLLVSASSDKSALHFNLVTGPFGAGGHLFRLDDLPSGLGRVRRGQCPQSHRVPSPECHRDNQRRRLRPQPRIRPIPSTLRFDIRFGSLADICSANRHVRFTPESGHVQRNRRCLLCANSGHWPSIRSPRRRGR
jgi:hypothetical protein